MLELIRFPDPPRTILGILLPGDATVSPALVDTGADLCLLDLYPIGFIIFDDEGFSELVRVLQIYSS